MHAYLLNLLLLASTPNDHAIYLSFVKLDMGKQEITIKVFSDDLDNVLRNYDVSYSSADSEKQREEILQSYFQDKFLVYLNDEKILLSYDKMSIENDASFLIFRFEKNESVTQITVRGDYFMELFPTQNNVIEIKKGQEKYFLRLTKNQSQSTVKINR